MVSFHFKSRFCNTLGLGLIVCKGVADEIGGRLDVISPTQAPGTKIYFSFPCYQIQEEENNYIEEEELIEEEEDNNNNKFDVQTCKVLVIDDESMILMFMKMYLQRMGFENIKSTDQWTEAVELMKKEKYDLLITDFRLGANFNASRMLKHVKNHGRPEVVVVASGDSQKVVKEEMDQVGGMEGFIPKPILTGPLRGVLDNYVKNLR